MKTINIMGIRGLPAAHGGFETFAGQLAPYLRDRGWAVNAYCQVNRDSGGHGHRVEDDWNGIHRIHFPTKDSAFGSVAFDWKCILDARRRPGVNLMLGYNTAIFGTVLRANDRPLIINMDGVEWKRAKWSVPIKAWFYLNELIGASIATVPIADHPEIARHLHRHGCRRAEMIAYGSKVIGQAALSGIEAMGLQPRRYLVSIARIEPENSILEIVRAYSRSVRAVKLIVLGNLADNNKYHRAVRAAASSDVIFAGAIYKKDVVDALRYHALAYLHGHQVGGTNPSLVEALGAGSAVIAHDNKFNRWVAGADQMYFGTEAECEQAISVITNQPAIAEQMRERSAVRHLEAFQLDGILEQYETLLKRFA